MSSTRTQVLLWANRIVSKRTAPPHELLEIAASGTVEAAQEAFHKIARLAHPDLHRAAMTPEELEVVTQAYAIVAGAYQAFRNQAMLTLKLKPVGKDDSKPNAAPNAPSPVSPSGSTSRQMSSRALVYYRKAELALKQGDLRGALLQLKMAIAADPASAFLRTALAEVEAEVGKK